MSEVYNEIAKRVKVEGLVNKACQELSLNYEERVNVKDAAKEMIREMLWRDDITSYGLSFDYHDLVNYMMKAMIVAMAAKDDILAERNSVRSIDDFDMLVEYEKDSEEN